MSVDKFGRIKKHKSVGVVKGLPGIGFKLTAEGDYDVKSKRIRFLASPIDDEDATNLETIKKQIELLKTNVNSKCKARVAECLRINELESYDAKGRKIKNIGLPEEDGDAINFKFTNELAEEIKKKHQTSYNTLSSTMKDMNTKLKENETNIKQQKTALNKLNSSINAIGYGYHQVELFSTVPVALSIDGRYHLLGEITEYKCLFSGAEIEIFDIIPTTTKIVFNNKEGNVIDNKNLIFNATIGFKPSDDELNKSTFNRIPLKVYILIKYPIQIIRKR